MEIPIVDLPSRFPIELSETYSTAEYRLKPGETDIVKWRKVPDHRVCGECQMLRLSNNGIPGTLIYRRVLNGRGRLASILMCWDHKKMWMERDRVDAADWCDTVLVERAINNYRYQRNMPLGRKLTETELLSLTAWFMVHGHTKTDILRCLEGAGSAQNWSRMERLFKIAQTYIKVANVKR